MPEPSRNLKIDIEIPVFLLYFAFSVCDSISSNLIIFRTCYVNLGYNETECALLGTDHPDNITSQLEKATQPFASRIDTLRKVPVGIITGVLCLFVGSWSDKFGRKPVILLGLIGFILYCVLQTLFALASHLASWYSLIWAVPVVVTGGLPCLQTVVLCYISDLTTENDRGFKMSLYQGALELGTVIGYISSSYILYATSYAVVYSISAVTVLIALIYVQYFVPESVQHIENADMKQKMKKLFGLNNLKDMLLTAFKRRPNYGRLILMTFILLATANMFIMFAENSVMSLFLRAKFSWSLTHVNMYIGIKDAVHAAGIFLGGFILEKLLEIPEAIIALWAFTTRVASSITLGFATTDATVYAAAGVHCLTGILGPALHSLISKLVPVAEIGRILSLTVTCETVLGILGPPLYTEIYSRTLEIDPGVFNFVTAGLYALLTVSAIMAIIRHHFVRRGYIALEDEIENPETEDREENLGSNPQISSTQ